MSLRFIIATKMTEFENLTIFIRTESIMRFA